MSTLQGINTDMSGKVGQFVYRRTKKGTVVAQAPRKFSVPRRSEKQMYLRCQIANMTANYHLFDDMLDLGFESKEVGQNEYNMYLKANYGKNPVFITAGMREDGACVLAPYTFTQGTLAVIGYALNGSNILVSNLALGSLTIGSGTTVGQLAQAVINNNAGWQDQDQLTFFYATQWADASGMPRATMNSWKVVLDLYDETPLQNVASALGFTTVGGYLGMNTALSNAGAAWVHSRNNGELHVSTQKMFVVSSVLSAFQSSNAMKVAADSYGGFNSKAVYLDPKATTSLAEVMADMSRTEDVSALLGAANENQNQGDSSNTGGGSNTGNGGNSGGSSTGSETGGNSGNGGNTGGNTGGSETSGTPVLTISKTGSGSATVSAGGNSLNSGAEVAAETEVSLSVTPATGQTPTATLNGTSVSLTESDGTYTGTFTMPNANATLVINTGSAEGYGDTN